MTDTPPATHLVSARTATSLIFLLCGIGLSCWVPMVPFAKSRLQLDEAALGIVLLFLGVGAMLIMPFTGYLIRKYSSKAIILICGLVIAAILPLLLLTSTVWTLGSCLFIFGMAIGGLDVSINNQAVMIQEQYGKPVMSSFHGLFSVGGLVGSLGIGALMDVGLQPIHAALIISASLTLIIVSQTRKLLAHEKQQDQDQPVFTLPSGPLLWLGILCFICFLAEGAMLDWSAVFLRFERGFPDSRTGLGFAVFSVTMSVMRLTGDRIVSKIGDTGAVFYGCLVASAGFLLTITFPNHLTTLFGFALIGTGAANIVPVLFSRAGTFPGMPQGAGLPAVTTMGYAGQLAGPALIGFVAHGISLPFAFGGISLLLLLAGIAFKFGQTPSGSALRTSR